MEEKREDGLDFGITRIGVNTGPAVSGNFGGNHRFDYTAHGDSINTAARMESVNKHLGTRVCVSGTTVAQCPGRLFRPIGSLLLKGKAQATDAYEPLTRDNHDSARVTGYLDAFEGLKNGDGNAESLFDDLKSRYPADPLVDLHRDRIKRGELSTSIVLAEK